jgi:L-alanine-DL-glutamate epimerase-like enolase superfamily enzyme
MDITAGEYGYTPEYFRRMIGAGAVDVLQADVTRCCGITGLLAVGDLCSAFELPFSAHCAPQIHAHAGCAVGRLRHCEYFHTHARAEQILFDGVLEPRDGCLCPDAGRPGLGIELKRADAEKLAA